MIKFFKILNNFDKINPYILFEINNATVTRDNGKKLKVRNCKTVAPKLYFNVSIVDYWHRFPAPIVSSKPIDSFKSRLDIYLRATSFN